MSWDAGVRSLSSSTFYRSDYRLIRHTPPPSSTKSAWSATRVEKVGCTLYRHLQTALVSKLALLSSHVVAKGKQIVNTLVDRGRNFFRLAIAPGTTFGWNFLCLGVTRPLKMTIRDSRWEVSQWGAWPMPWSGQVPKFINLLRWRFFYQTYTVELDHFRAYVTLVVATVIELMLVALVFFMVLTLLIVLSLCILINKTWKKNYILDSV